MQKRRCAGPALLAALTAILVGAPSVSAQPFAGELTNYVDERQQTQIEFGDRSHWHQPWRAWLETVPAVRFQAGTGIVFNVTDAQAEPAARLLAASGFKRARFEVGWTSLRYDDPSRLNNLASVKTRLLALKKYGIRPLILLNGNDGGPVPAKALTLRTVEPALEGDTRVHLDAATAAAVVPRKTGFNGFQTSGKAADPLITSIEPDGWANLSRPLRRDLPVGAYPGTRLLYEPFFRPFRADGTPEPRFEATMAGWLNYVKVVTREVKTILGNQQFDVEIWNELMLASEFLEVDEYYDPNIDEGDGDVPDEILHRTVAWLRDPANGVSAVGIGNGFANHRYQDAGSTSPPGLTAIDKHPYLYGGMRRFPPAPVDSTRPLDAQGDPDGIFDGSWTELFTPTYQDFHPERYLWATWKWWSSPVEMDDVFRDISPHTTYIDGVAHGRHTHPPGSPPPEVWITEMNLNPLSAPSSFGVKATDRVRMQAKSTLRTLTAFINKGVSAVYMYAASSGNYALVDPAFFTTFQQTQKYPGDNAGGLVTTAVRRLTKAFAGAVPIAQPRQLTLAHVGDYAGNKQFEGDGTADHPPLYNRDVLAFLPFQVDPGRFVVAVYVMTSNMAKKYKATAPTTDPTRFDMPPERYRLSIGGAGGPGAAVTATDPLTGVAVPVEVISSEPGSTVVQLPVTDSPRLLTIDETP